MKTLWDPIRCKTVAATPEEKVRQKWILAMIGPLGYPKGLIAVEKNIETLYPGSLPANVRRRIDILCYMPHREGLTPLLIIECKAEDEGEDPERQVLGYNFTLQAPFLCVIHGEKAKTFWKEGDKIVSIPFLPMYCQLREKV